MPSPASSVGLGLSVLVQPAELAMDSGHLL
jgi:hypothetical protein